MLILLWYASFCAIPATVLQPLSVLLVFPPTHAGFSTSWKRLAARSARTRWRRWSSRSSSTSTWAYWLPATPTLVGVATLYCKVSIRGGTSLVPRPLPPNVPGYEAREGLLQSAEYLLYTAHTHSLSYPPPPFPPLFPPPSSNLASAPPPPFLFMRKLCYAIIKSSL